MLTESTENTEKNNFKKNNLKKNDFKKNYFKRNAFKILPLHASVFLYVQDDAY